jgi:histidinol-phosphatase (PHP family)
LAAHPAIDYFIGSLHHVNGVPIDYDREYYARAMASVTATTASENSSSSSKTRLTETEAGEERMYERYYDQQFEMLVALRPRVVGHFDLIRLMSVDPDRDVRRWPGVWERIERNLTFVSSYGGWLECNSSALRKGLAEPYPCRVIAEVVPLSTALLIPIPHYILCLTDLDFAEVSSPHSPTFEPHR